MNYPRQQIYQSRVDALIQVAIHRVCKFSQVLENIKMTIKDGIVLIVKELLFFRPVLAIRTQTSTSPAELNK